MWYEFPIPSDFERQKQIIRQLKNWIQDLEERQLIDGFAFNHYFGSGKDELRIRFDFNSKENLNEVRNELQTKLEELVESGNVHERTWESPEYILRAYEFGSRCTFLFWELVERGRFSEDYVTSFLPTRAGSEIPLNFQQCFNHGVMNSLGIPKAPHEQVIHLLALIESTRSRNPDELCQWLRNAWATLGLRQNV